MILGYLDQMRRVPDPRILGMTTIRWTRFSLPFWSASSAERTIGRRRSGGQAWDGQIRFD